MPESKRPLKVFLCHAHSDKNAVRDLYLRLVKDGVDAWLDKEKLLPGQDWEREIRRAVREADIVVVCLSNQFNQAGFRQKEVRLALDTAMEKTEGEIFIIPARLEECEAPENLLKWHWVDLFEENGYQNLLRAIAERARGIGKPASSKPLLDVKTGAANDKPRPGPLPTSDKTNPRRPWTFVAGGVFILAAFCAFCLLLWGAPYLMNIFRPTPTASPTLRPVIQDTATSSTVFTATPASADTPVPSPVAAALDVPMVLIPAGEFTMGSNIGEIDERPSHTVYLDEFSIDKYEVTNLNYQACVKVGTCLPPVETRSETRPDYYGNSKFNNYPVIFVDWNMAKAYCGWRGMRLPTEAEWEKAARGTDARTYPWGEEFDLRFANYAKKSGDTEEVGLYEIGQSPYGVYDMAGNVWEWVSDRYQQDYYASSPSRNPLGPETGDYHVFRGGSWFNFEAHMRVTNREGYPATYADINIGFRCAVDAIQ
jgi:formylglycine-generating enzyme required for sulfatase activity